MTLRRRFDAFVRVVAEQAERDPDFARRLEAALGGEFAPARSPRRRRAPAAFDPIAAAHDGEATLRARLAELSADQLKDMIAEHGLDPTGRASRWRKPERLVELIVDRAVERAQKGRGFGA
ncbi:MAG: hypothetical protein ACLFTG_13965 [Alphaproteobacteria bacterium]